MKALACVGLVALSSACLDREVSFHFTSGTSSDGTLSDVTRPMMVGTTETIEARSTTMFPLATLSSSDPSVVSISKTTASCCTTHRRGGEVGGQELVVSCNPAARGEECLGGEMVVSAEVVALKAGTVSIAVLDWNGRELATATGSVSDPATVMVSCDSGNQTLAVNHMCAPSWTAVDAKGDLLQASRGLHFTSSDPTVAGFLTVAEVNLNYAQSGSPGSPGSPRPEAEGDQDFGPAGTSPQGLMLLGSRTGRTRITGSALNGASATMNLEVTP